MPVIRGHWCWLPEKVWSELCRCWFVRCHMMDVWWPLKRRYFVQFPRFCAGYDLQVGAHNLRGSCDKKLNDQNYSRIEGEKHFQFGLQLYKCWQLNQKDWFTISTSVIWKFYMKSMSSMPRSSMSHLHLRTLSQQWNDNDINIPTMAMKSWVKPTAPYSDSQLVTDRANRALWTLLCHYKVFCMGYISQQIDWLVYQDLICVGLHRVADSTDTMS